MSNWNFEQIAKIQKALAQRGFDPGVIDGVWGRRTEGAVRAFQTTRGLESDGVVGPLTWTKLFGTEPDMAPLDNPALVWFQEARRLLGIKEKNGSGNNEVIVDWAGDLGIPYKTDDIPWCGLFVAHCIGSTLSREALPNNPLGARNWLKFGAPCDPSLGAVLVFWRGKPTGWQGHVGLYAGEEPSGILHVLGGNQSDKVSIVRMARNRLLGARWPATAPVGNGGAHKVPVGKSILSSKED